MSNINENENSNAIGNDNYAVENNGSAPVNHITDNEKIFGSEADNAGVVTSESRSNASGDIGGNVPSTQTEKNDVIASVESESPECNPINTVSAASVNYAEDHVSDKGSDLHKEAAADITSQTHHEGYAVEHQAESAGIRYNADKNSADGNYTWQYCNSGNAPAPMYHPPKKKHSVLKTVLISVGCVAAIGVLGVMSLFIYRSISGEPMRDFDDHGIIRPSKDKDDRFTDPDTPVIGRNDEDTRAPAIIVSPDENGVLTKQMIAVKCKPSSVGIEVTTTTQSYFGAYKSSGVGSGFILTEDGYIATNNHVVAGADEVTVMLDDGTKYPAKLIGTDSLTDLAVIKIEASGLTPMEIGDSDLMQVGDSVIAIGTPAGIEFAGTVTDGIVSAINREVEVSAGNGYTKKMTLMQTNAAINPGNSGGPLINNKGQVVGINTLKLTEEYEGIGFSIPINSAVSIFNQLISDGRVTNYDQSFVTGNGSIGISAADVTEEESKFYNIPVGVLVRYVKPGSSASAAGLRGGDIITAFNGVKTSTVAELNELKADYKAGDEVTLTVYRDPNEYVDITFKLDVMG